MDRKEELRLASLERMEAARKRQAAEYHRRWYEKHKEEHLAKVKKWQAENRERYLAYQREYHRECRKKEARRDAEVDS